MVPREGCCVDVADAISTGTTGDWSWYVDCPADAADFQRVATAENQ